MMRRSIWWMIAAGVLLLSGGLAEAVGAQDGQEAPASDPAEKRLLEVGKVSPDFTLPLINGGDVTLSNLFKTHKAVVVAFFSIDEEGGGADMVKLQKLHEELGGKGLATVAINPEDELRDVSRFARNRKIDFQVCIDGKETNRAVTNVYKAKKLPTYYLIDPQGKVLWRAIGYKEPALREAITAAGIK